MITVLKKKVEFEKSHFEQTIELLLIHPNYISPCIQRAEILTKSETLVKRKLVPRQYKRDCAIYQMIRMDHSTERLGFFYTAHNPSFTDRAKAEDLPYFYPKVLEYYYEYNCSDRTLSISYRPFPNLGLDKRWDHIWTRIAALLCRFSLGCMNGYKKRVHHDLIIEKIAFQEKYKLLKEKYVVWVGKWPDSTDASKHVFEDISIATWLILLWKEDKQSSKRYKFCDVGCGNGFLTYILRNEGFNGFGVDLSSRPLWTQFENSKDYLLEKTIQPLDEKFDHVDWLIGNHPDELTAWIPIWAAQNSCNFMIIPCCLFNLDGSRFTNHIVSLGRYKTYCEYLVGMCTRLGFLVEKEMLRIPSTKNVCIMSRNGSKGNASRVLDELVKGLGEIRLRKSDQQKTRERFEERNKKLEIIYSNSNNS